MCLYSYPFNVHIMLFGKILNFIGTHGQFLYSQYEAGLANVREL